MIDAGLAAGGMLKRIDRSADSTMRLAHTYTLSERKSPVPEQRAEQVAKDFEALFLSQMLGQMFGDSLGEEFFGSEETSDIYRNMMVEEFGRQITRGGGIGIADYVKRELLKMQEV